VSAGSKKAPLFVVGLGASAGGLEPFQQIVREIPKDSGMAYVLVQHINPNHSSMLVHILSRVTATAVMEIEDGMRVLPNHIYVLPPNASMAMSKGLLRLMPRIEIAGKLVCIDYFFHTLALDRNNRAMGVVLSGTASDGVVGLKSIKANGGVTFAQTPDSARFAEMPVHAIRAGCVDYILPPEQIAGKILEIGQAPPREHATPVPAPSGSRDKIEEVSSMLWSIKPGAYSPHEKQMFRNALDYRMKAQRAGSIEKYAEKLRTDAGEVEALYEDLLARFAGFFKDPEVFAVLKRSVFPQMLGRSAAKIWVPGCSTGEEPYSLAINILEYVRQNKLATPVQIFATDVSDSSLNKARRAAYAENMMIGVSQERRWEFFVPAEGGFRVAGAVRGLCVFGRHDVTNDPPFSRLDMIFMRNMITYLHESEHEKIFSQFHYGLNPKGYLVLGAGESVDVPSQLFETVDAVHQVYRKR
jgi:two-component system CheB/CheR fusion protein